MKKTDRTSRKTAQKIERRMPRELEQVCENDELFFLLHANRTFRMRLLSDAEVGFMKRAGVRLNSPMSGMRRVALVSKLPSGSRLKLTCQLPESADLEVTETECRGLFTAVLTADGARIEEGSLAGAHGPTKYPSSQKRGL